MNNAERILLFFIILCAAVILPITAFQISAFHEGFYKKEFSKFNVYASFPGEDIEKINRDVLGYLGGKKEAIENDFFNEKELSHLADVKKIFHSVFLVFYITLIIFVILFSVLSVYNKKILDNISIISIGVGLLGLIVSGIIFLAVWLGFDRLFNDFHEVFFLPGTWVFGAGDRITALYTWGFFNDITFRIVATAFVFSVFLICAGLILRKYSNKTEK